MAVTWLGVLGECGGGVGIMGHLEAWIYKGWRGVWLAAALTVLCGAGAVRGVAAPSVAALAGASGASSPLAVVGVADTAWVQFNHRLVFPVVTSGDQNAQDRADLATLRLEDLLRGQMSGTAAADAPKAVVVGSPVGPVVQVGASPLLSVTTADAARAGTTPGLLASTWAAKINTAIGEALRERRPAYLRWAAKQALILLLVGAALHAVLWGVARGLHERFGWTPFALLWGVVAWHVADLFPLSRPALPFLLTGWPRPLTLAVFLGVATATLARFWSITLRRIFPPLGGHGTAIDLTHRSVLRRITLASVADVTGKTLLWFVAVVVGLSWSGVNLSALLASAGLIGVALGLVAQDTLRDIIAGVSILADDRFGVGDTIQVGTWDGTVERLNLRVTQLRDSSGRLITLSNRSVSEVANQTARWAQVDFRIGVSYYSDMHAALTVLEQTAQGLAKEWSERLPEPPQMLGVDGFTDQNITLRLLLRTAPGDQWAVARELRLRVKAAFDAAGIVVLNSLYAAPPVPKTAVDDGAAMHKGD